MRQRSVLLFNLYSILLIVYLKGKRITRAAIQSSLGIGESIMSEALLGSRLAKKYGANGSHQSPDVISELTAVRPAPSGRSALLQFLNDWEHGHA